MLPWVGLPWIPGEGVKWSGMLVTSDTSMQAKGARWQRAQSGKLNLSTKLQFSFRGISKGVTESLLGDRAQKPGSARQQLPMEG